MRQLWTENLRSAESGSFQSVLELVQAGVAGATVSASPRSSLDSEARRIVQAVRARHNVEVPVGVGDLADKPTGRSAAEN